MPVAEMSAHSMNYDALKRIILLCLGAKKKMNANFKSWLMINFERLSTHFTGKLHLTELCAIQLNDYLNFSDSFPGFELLTIKCV